MRLSHSLTTVLLAATFVAMGPVANPATAESFSARGPVATLDLRSAQQPVAFNAFAHAAGGRVGMAKKAPSCDDIFLAIYDGTLAWRQAKENSEAAHMWEGVFFSMFLEINGWASYITTAYFESQVAVAELNLDILYVLSNSYGCMSGQYY